MSLTFLDMQKDIPSSIVLFDKLPVPDIYIKKPSSLKNNTGKHNIKEVAHNKTREFIYFWIF